MCGISIEVPHGDLSLAELSGTAGYPRTLIAGGTDYDGDGRVTEEMLCWDPKDCEVKCDYLKRTSALTHGAGTPPACSM